VFLPIFFQSEEVGMSSTVVVAEAKTQQPLIAQSANSFVGGFNYTLAPYSGCEYGCSYCYVPDVLRGLPSKRGGWGNYVDVRSRAVELLQRKAEQLKGASIFLAATTDPYQPVEAQAKLTRQLLEALMEIDFSFLLISTRSGLILRDLDLFTDDRLRSRLEIGLSIPSDIAKAHEELEPRTAPFKGRLMVARRLRDAGIATRIHIAPLALCTQDFAKRAGESATWLWVDGTGHGARRSLKGQYWLRDYSYALYWSEVAAQQLGRNRVGYGRNQFAWRWDSTQNQIVPPAGRKEK
jgi:hypothetical protein